MRHLQYGVRLLSVTAVIAVVALSGSSFAQTPTDNDFTSTTLTAWTSTDASESNSTTLTASFNSSTTADWNSTTSVFWNTTATTFWNSTTTSASNFSSTTAWNFSSTTAWNFSSTAGSTTPADFWNWTTSGWNFSSTTTAFNWTDWYNVSTPAFNTTTTAFNWTTWWNFTTTSTDFTSWNWTDFNGTSTMATTPFNWTTTAINTTWPNTTTAGNFTPWTTTTPAPTPAERIAIYCVPVVYWVYISGTAPPHAAIVIARPPFASVEEIDAEAARLCAALSTTTAAPPTQVPRINLTISCNSSNSGGNRSDTPPSFSNKTSWANFSWYATYEWWSTNRTTDTVTLSIDPSVWNTPDKLQLLIDFVCWDANSTSTTMAVTTSMAPFTTAAPTSTRAPDRTRMLRWFYLTKVLAKTPIFTVGTTLTSNAAVQAALFSTTLAAYLRSRGLWMFIDAEAVAVVQMTHCAVSPSSELRTTPISPYMCRSERACTTAKPACWSGVRSCVCPSPSSWLPLSDTYIAALDNSTLEGGQAASLAVDSYNEWEVDGSSSNGNGGRRQLTSPYVQFQFPLRLDVADSYFPESPLEIVNILAAAVNHTTTFLHNATVVRQFRIDVSFIFLRYAYDDLGVVTAAPFIIVPEEGPQLLWLLVLLVFPFGGGIYALYRFRRYYRWRQYGRKLRVHLGGYNDVDAGEGDGQELTAVVAGLGTADWIAGEAAKDDPVEAVAAPDAAHALDQFDLELDVGDDV